MIVKMQQLTLFMSAKGRKAALKKLQNLGVVHIRHFKVPESENIDAILADLSQVGKALEVVAVGPEDKAVHYDTDAAKDAVKEILYHEKQSQTAAALLQEKQETLQWFETWGSFSYGSVEELRDAGIFLKLYLADKAALKDLPEDATIEILSEAKGTIRLACFASSPDFRLDLKEEPIPAIELDVLKGEIAELEQTMSQMTESLTELIAKRPLLMAYQADLTGQLEFSQVLAGMGEEENIVMLQGYCPVDAVANVKEIADNDGWGYMIGDPEDETEAPTLIKNPKWLRIIDPLFQFMGTLPGYDEQDISFWFLLFFSLFFGMLIGDAGYGLVFLGISLYASKKAGKDAPKEAFRLINVLSIATIVWGVLSGNWFGFEQIGRLPGFNWFIIDQIDSFSTTNSMFMMYFCFVIGIIHLTIAHALNALKQINSLKAIGQLGWIGILWTLFFVAGNLVIGKPMPGFTGILFLVSVIVALVFCNFQKNILKGIGVTFGDLPLSIISSFSDIVSYLRLFAVGYASVTVASSFNNMAVGNGIQSILAGFVAALVLFLGHSLNIALGLMSVIVHGVRLNVLEFSGHLNMQWAGKPYKPFKK